MTAESRDTITFALGTCITVLTIVALAVKFILLPWLREHLVSPLHDTRQQVTDNGHKNDPPTLPDMIHDVKRDVGALSRVMDEHLRWSERWTDLTEREVAFIRQQLDAHHKKRGTEHDKPNPTA